MITDLGSLTLGVIVPGAADAVVSIELAAGVNLPDVALQIAALTNFTPTVPTSYADQILAVEAVITELEAAINAVPPLTPPSLSAQLAFVVAAQASLTARLNELEGQLLFSGALADILATSGVRLFAYDGQQDLFGGELATALGASTTHCNALVILTTSGATWTTMGSLFKTT